MKRLLNLIFTKIENKFLPEITSVREHQQFFVLLYSSTITLAGVPLNLLGLTGPDTLFFSCLNIANWTITLMSLILLANRKISLKQAIITIAVSTQLETSGEMIYCALYPSYYHTMLIVGNLVLCAITVLFSVAADIRKLPIALTVLSMGTYSLCTLITKDESLINFFIIFTLVFTTICILGERLIHTVKILELENKNLKQDEEELLRFLRMNKQQVRTYIEFSKKKNPDEKEMKHLLELLDESSQRNIINSVSHFLIEKQTTIEQISLAFPELTPSEHEICRLILQGKKLSDICEILNKTENNVTAHRGHIRKKLNLKPEDNLKKSLEIRMQQTDFK